ncbi:MAG: hypothetical protein FWG88_02685 [Oscillospiraceae bacterium]|nr:hypothetical protein [Oscillospiraceae bacterium]
MSYFYTITTYARVWITLLIAMSVLLQMLALYLLLFRRKQSPIWWTQISLEILILLQLFTLSLMHGQLMQASHMGLYITRDYGIMRNILFTAITALSLIGTIYGKKPKNAYCIVISAMTFPLLEQSFSTAFPVLFLLALILWTIRSISIVIEQQKGMKEELSAMSIRSAMDFLGTGVMFCEKNGYIVLVNMEMQRLMMKITGRIHRNGKHFYDLIASGDLLDGWVTRFFQDQNVCIYQDGSAWVFGTIELSIGKKKYLQITATDITEQWKLIALLQSRNEELLQRQASLSRAIKNVNVLTYEIETQKAKMRVHDVLSERLTLLIRTVRGEHDVDQKLLLGYTKGLMEDLKAVRTTPSPMDELDSIIETYAYVNVAVIVNGKLPDDKEVSQLFVDIIREAVSNAVRHGFATEVNVDIDQGKSESTINITDNGYVSPEGIKEGGGILGMKSRVEPLGGFISVASSPQFELTVIIPVSREK